MTPLQLQCRYCETYKAALSRIFPASPEVMGKLFRCCSQVICINVRWEKRFMAEESWHCCHKCLKTRQGEVWGCRKLWAFRITGIFNAPASGQSLFVPCCDNFPPDKSFDRSSRMRIGSGARPIVKEGKPQSTAIPHIL